MLTLWNGWDGMQVKRAEARAEQAWYNWHPDRDIKDTHFVSDLLADVDVCIFLSLALSQQFCCLLK